MPVLKQWFYQNRPKIKSVLQKIQNFLAAWPSASRPPMASGWGFRNQTPETALIADFWLRA